MKKTIRIFLLSLLFASRSFGQDTQLEEFIKAGIVLHDKQQYKEAIASFQKALQLDDKSPIANYEIANTYFALKDYENAIAFSENVIKLNKDYLGPAYILKGSAEDIMGNSADAVKTYKSAIKKFPESHLLHYNLGLTLYHMKAFEKAESSLQDALTANPNHASSHLLMAYLMADQSLRVKSLLALYNFLLVEPSGERANNAYQLLQSQLKKGVKKDGDNTINIMLSMDKKSDEFRSAELMLSMLEASKNLETNKNKSAQQLFSENTASFFTILGELRGKSKGFWQKYYVDFFYSLEENELVETLTYYISQSANNTEVDNWVKENNMKIDALSKWYVEYKR